MKRTVERISLPFLSPGTRRELAVRHYGTSGARPRAHLQAALLTDEHPGLLPTSLCAPMPLDGTDVIAAFSSGIVACRRKLGELAMKGVVMTEIVDLTAGDGKLAHRKAGSLLEA
ncbi:MAG: hypothetical protein OEZ03_02985 [Alphaproteobacteria bacterium]|nr:hypothetical protein [Alphaproteobacteria bacterium]